MSKIVLGARPKSFAREIKLALHDGSVGTMQVTYKYRTRSEYGAFVDAIMKATQEAAEAAAMRAIAESEANSETGLEQVLKKTTADNIDFILQAVEGWNLDAPFSREALEQLADELPHAPLAIINDYRLACTEGRLGN